jgi:hypothetical protein
MQDAGYVSVLFKFLSKVFLNTMFKSVLQMPFSSCACLNLRYSSSSSIGTTTRVGFRPAQLSLSILSRKVLQSAVASGTSNPQLGGEPVI